MQVVHLKSGSGFAAVAACRFNNGISRRESPKKMTTNPAEVTCKNCKK